MPLWYPERKINDDPKNHVYMPGKMELEALVIQFPGISKKMMTSNW